MRVTTLLFSLCSAATAMAQVATAPLVGIVVDPAGQPVVGAPVVVQRGLGRGFRCLDLELYHRWLPLARTRTDARGRFGVQVPVGLALRVEVDHAPLARWYGEDMVPGDDLRIELQRPCTLRGALRLQDGGAPTEGSVRAWNAQRVEVCAGRTDEHGTFTFDRLPPGDVTIEVIPDAARTPDWLQATLTADAPLQHTFELQRGVELQAAVVDADTGEPIAGAQVGEGWTLHKSARTDAKGELVLAGHGDPSRPDLHCRADGYVEQRIDRPAQAEPWTRIRFELSRGVDVAGRILDPAGTPRAEAYVAVIGMTQKYVPWLPARTRADGAFRCVGLPPLCEGVLLVRCDGFATAVYALPVATKAGVAPVPDVRLQPARLVRGVLHDDRGQPVPHASVTLHGCNADCETFAALPANWSTLRFYLAQRTARTNARGEFAFGDLAPGSYELALGDGNIDNRADPVRVEVTAEGEIEPVELVKVR